MRASVALPTSSAFAPGCRKTPIGTLGLPLRIDVEIVVARAELDAGHVLQAHDAARWRGVDHDLAELLGVGEATLRRHREREVDASGHRLLADTPGGELRVLLA